MTSADPKLEIAERAAARVQLVTDLCEFFSSRGIQPAEAVPLMLQLMAVTLEDLSTAEAVECVAADFRRYHEYHQSPLRPAPREA
jgi:uncharacterized protein YoaH (UPF0181 family)